MCEGFKVHRLAEYYAWLKQAISAREQEDSRLFSLMKEHYSTSGGTYGSPWVYRDLRDGAEASAYTALRRLCADIE